MSESELTQVRCKVALIQGELARHVHVCDDCSPPFAWCPVASVLIHMKKTWQKQAENCIRVKEMLEP